MSESAVTPSMSRRAAPKKDSGHAVKKRGAVAGNPKESTLYVNSVEKALQIIHAFGPQRKQLTLTQIAAFAGMDMSTVQRFTHTLVALDLLRKPADTKVYELSPRMMDFGRQYIVTNDLVSQSMPFLQHLAMETEAAVNLSIQDDIEIIYLQRIVSRYVLSSALVVGTRLPAYCTSGGLAILAALPHAQAEDILARSELVKYTRHTINDKKQILARLDVIREQGYSHVEDEMYLGDISIAVAIVNSDNQPIGAINVGVARPQWKGEEDLERISSLLIAAGRAISSRQ